MESMVQGQNGINPDHPKHTNAAGGDEHGNEGISSAPDGTGENFDAHKSDIPRGQKPHDAHPFGQNRLIGAEQAKCSMCQILPEMLGFLTIRQSVG